MTVNLSLWTAQKEVVQKSGGEKKEREDRS